MIDIIDSLIQTIKDPFDKYPDYKKIFWHDVPDSQKMIKPVGRAGQSATGYGRKITTDKMINYGGRWHRVYCRIYGNSGTCYFISKGEKIVIS